MGHPPPPLEHATTLSLSHFLSSNGKKQHHADTDNRSYFIATQPRRCSCRKYCFPVICLTHNQQTKNSENSLHTSGCAVQIHVPYHTIRILLLLCVRRVRSGVFPVLTKNLVLVEDHFGSGPVFSWCSCNTSTCCQCYPVLSMPPPPLRTHPPLPFPTKMVFVCHHPPSLVYPPVFIPRT